MSAGSYQALDSDARVEGQPTKAPHHTYVNNGGAYANDSDFRPLPKVPRDYNAQRYRSQLNPGFRQSDPYDDPQPPSYQEIVLWNAPRHFLPELTLWTIQCAMDICPQRKQFQQSQPFIMTFLRNTSNALAMKQSPGTVRWTMWTCLLGLSFMTDAGCFAGLQFNSKLCW